jgi:HSP20 family protein
MADKTAAERSPAPGRSEAPSAQYPLFDLRRQMDRLFDEFQRGFGLPAGWGLGAPLAPQVRAAREAADVRFEVTEDQDAIRVRAELPGLDADDVSVDVAGGVLTVQGEKSAEQTETKGAVHLSERSYGAFRRDFRLPDSVDPEAIEAQVEKGVLTVTLPKTAEARSHSRRVDVRRG